MRPPLGEPEGHAVVLALGAGADRVQLADAVDARGSQARGPRRAEERVVHVQPAGDVHALGVVVLDEAREIASELAFGGHAAVVGARVLEVLAEDEDLRVEGAAHLALRNEVRVGGDGAEQEREGAVAEERLATAAVGRAGRGEGEAGNPPVEHAAVHADDRAPVTLGIPGEPDPGLEHLPVRRDGAVRGEGLRARGRGHRLADERCVEDLARRGDHVGLLLALPAQPVLDGQVAAGLPLVLDEERDARLRDVLRARLFDAQPADARLLQVQKDGARDARPAGAGPGLGGGAVRALHVLRVPRVVQEAVGGAEDVTAVGEAEEGLHALDRVELAADLERVPPLDDGQVVVELDPLVVVRNRDEERLAEAVAAAEVEGGVGQRPVLAVDERAAVRTRPVLPGELETELVEDHRREARDERTAAGMRVVLLDRVRAAAPGVDVERPVLLLGPGVVVAQGQEVVGIELPVDLGQQHPRVVGAIDGAVLVGAAEAGKVVDDPRLDAGGIGLLGGAAVLVIEGHEVERLVLLEGPAEGEAELLLAEIGLRRVRAVAALGRRRQAVALEIRVRGAVDVVGPGLGDDVDEAAAAASELGRSALGHHDDLLDRIQVEGEGGPLAAALLTEEGVVEVRAVDGDVVGDALLAVDRELVAVGALNDADPWSELGEIEEVPPVVGQPPDRRVVDAGRALRARGLHEGDVGGDHHLLLHRRHLQDQGEVHRLPDREVQPLPDEGGEAGHGHGHAVGAEGQQQPAKAPVGVGAHDALEVGGRVLEGHGGPRDRRPALVEDDAFDDAGGGLRLGAGRHRGNHCGQQDDGRPERAGEPRHDIHSLPRQTRGAEDRSLVT